MDPFSKSQRQNILIAALAVIIVACFLPALLRKNRSAGAGPANGLPEAESVAKTPASPGASAQRPRGGVEPLPPVDPSKGVEAVQAEIADLSSQYDPSAVRPLAAYLYHTDPEVRSAARRGLMQLGEADAVPYLRAAEKQELDPAEAKELLEAAEFLALPPMKFVPKVKEKK